jgi:hypothetical protein
VADTPIKILLTFSPKRKKWYPTRVTGLGEFSPLGRLLNFGSFFRITEICSLFFATFYPRKELCINFVKTLAAWHPEQKIPGSTPARE